MEVQSARIAAMMAGLEAKAAAAEAGESTESPTHQGSEFAAPNSKPEHLPNTLSLHGNQATMNINPLILTNIQGSPYFKKDLFALKTFHEVIDELYYKVDHLEPWERGSRKTSGQVGMCGGVRGVGAGGVASTAYCILFKLFTLRLTRRQLNVMLYHQDSPYIRGIGFLYIRYTQAPQDLFTWYERFLDDEEEIDPKSGGGDPMTIGDLVRRLLRKLDWYATMFPRIPVKYAKEIDEKLKNYRLKKLEENKESNEKPEVDANIGGTYDELMEKHIREQETSTDTSRSEKQSATRNRTRSRSRSRPSDPKSSSGKEKKDRSRSRDRTKRSTRSRSRSQHKRSSKEGDRESKSKKKKLHQSSDSKRRSSRSRSRKRSRSKSSKRDKRERKRSRSDHKKSSSKHKSKKSRKRSGSNRSRSKSPSKHQKKKKDEKKGDVQEEKSDLIKAESGIKLNKTDVGDDMNAKANEAKTDLACEEKSISVEAAGDENNDHSAGDSKPEFVDEVGTDKVSEKHQGDDIAESAESLN